MAASWSIIAVLPLALWLYLTCFRGGFWRAAERLGDDPAEPAAWPEVVAIVPARDEADTIGEAVGSLLRQDYPGRFSIIVVDDQSEDGTAAVARATAAAADAAHSLTVVRSAPLPEGWTGKVWAMATGVRLADERHAGARLLLFTDADIAHPPAGLRRLVAKAEAEQLDLISLMALLAKQGAWQALLIPAFVFFFQKLYPFPWVNDPSRRTAAAAGGCMLVRAKTLQCAGGLATIRAAVIDDCALARLIADGGGRLWLGLGLETRGLRPYDGLGGVWRMVARSAYSQLGYSPWALAGTVAGMAVAYLLAPLLVLGWPWHDDAVALTLALAAWGLMALSFRSTLALYGKGPQMAPLLPLAGLLYTLMTIDSAYRHARGRGAAWKGRVGVGHRRSKRLEHRRRSG